LKSSGIPAHRLWQATYRPPAVYSDVASRKTGAFRRIGRDVSSPASFEALLRA
jgi:hypothetical protein